LSHIVTVACHKEKLELGTESKSTKDVIAAMDEFNNRVRPPQKPSETLVIGSMDRIALYPSYKIVKSAVVVQAQVTKYPDSFTLVVKSLFVHTCLSVVKSLVE
jgi:hypothetical protein